MKTNHIPTIQSRRKAWGGLLILSYLCLGSITNSHAASVTGSWTADTTLGDGTAMTDLTQYTLFYSTVSFQRTGVWISTVQASVDPLINQVAVPSTIGSQVTSAVINGLNVGSTYYFRMTAVSAAGGQSAFNVDAISGLDVQVSSYIAPQPPSITSAGTANGRMGMPFSYTIAATNSPTSYNATGLPGGLSVNTTTGLISGTPTATGSSSVTLSASNPNGTGSGTLSMTIVFACDVNSDGSINVSDVQLEVNQVLGAAACTTPVNLSGTCTVTDVQRIANAALGGQCIVGP